MRWPWATRAEVEDIVWAVLPRAGALLGEAAAKAGFTYGRTGAALRRLKKAGRVTTTMLPRPKGYQVTLWVPVDDPTEAPR